jgi:flagellar protein FliO/FliZ
MFTFGNIRLGLLAVALGLTCTLGHAADPTPASLGDEGIISPRHGAGSVAGRPADSSFSPWTMIGLVALLGGAGLWMMRRGNLGARSSSVPLQRLSIDETRPLGNKQFLAVASYGDRRLLLAVCPGRIDMLCRLDDTTQSLKFEDKTESNDSLK